MSVPQDWIPPTAAVQESRPSREQVVAGLKATDEGDPDLVQLLTPEGERVSDPRFDRYATDLDVDALRDLYRDMVLVRRFDREGNALQRQGQLGIWVPLLGPGGRADRRGPRACSPRTWPSRPTASTAWPGPAASTPPSCSASSAAPTTAAGTRRRPGFHLYTIVIGNQVPERRRLRDGPALRGQGG